MKNIISVKPYHLLHIFIVFSIGLYSSIAFSELVVIVHPSQDISGVSKSDISLDSSHKCIARNIFLRYAC